MSQSGVHSFTFNPPTSKMGLRLRYTDPAQGNPMPNPGTFYVEHIQLSKNENQFVADLQSAQEYYPFGMQVPGRILNGGDYRYGFNGKENDNEVKGNGNSIDFGARVHDPRIGRFLSLDPMSSNFPSETNYGYASNNPVFYIDVDGKYKWPAGLEAEYTKKYPKLTKYLSENVKNDVLKSATIVNALEVNSRKVVADIKGAPKDGNLQGETLEKALTWGDGPAVMASDKPGNTWAGELPNGWYELSDNTIEINSKIFESTEKILADENATDLEKQEALLNFYKTLVHETAHYGDGLDGSLDGEMVQGQGQTEVGDNLDVMVWGEAVDNGHETLYVPKEGQDVNTKEGRENIIKSGEDKDRLPTVPK